MPQQHYRCPDCGEIDLVIYTLADVSSPDWPPRCVHCHARSRMEMAPQQMLTDLRTDGEGDRAFQKFSVHVNGKREIIDSVHKLRQVERDSEQRYRNGEGEPIRFRLWNNESTNRDINSFGDGGQIGERAYSNGTQPTPKPSGKIGVRRHGQERPTIATARHAGKSALGQGS